MLDGPCFTQPLKRAPGGDYLAMGSVHEKLYLRSLPGMNNTVRHIRPYSALCWMAREIEKHARARNLTGSAAAAVFNAGLWKIDALMLWTSHGDGTRLPGYTKFDRAVANNDLAGITNRRTRLFSPANYQPSLVNGFGWLQLDESLGIYVCSEAGRKLADAFESHLRKTLTSHQIRWLADPYQTVCGPTKLAALQPALTVATTAEETKAFTSSFVRAQYADDWAFGGPDRRATLLLALRAIDALNGTADDQAVTDLDHIREAMLCGVTRAGAQLDVSIGTARQQWHVMQLRALQRLAMECL
ncbi:hypothetical protein AB3332_23145, partial [Ralstonia solanacearum]|uniref:hypothetical protein n=1 Tax=Ralstonia solanacearum TaxID=305 RepID=UPI0034DDC3C4